MIGHAVQNGRKKVIFGRRNIIQTRTDKYKDGCRSVDRISCSLVTSVSRQMQSDGY